jgi:hypothetical protein
MFPYRPFLTGHQIIHNFEAESDHKNSDKMVKWAGKLRTNSLVTVGTLSQISPKEL